MIAAVALPRRPALPDGWALLCVCVCLCVCVSVCVCVCFRITKYDCVGSIAIASTTMNTLRHPHARTHTYTNKKTKTKNKNQNQNKTKGGLAPPFKGHLLNPSIASTSAALYLSLPCDGAGVDNAAPSCTTAAAAAAAVHEITR